MTKDYTEELLQSIERLVEARLAEMTTDQQVIGTIKRLPTDDDSFYRVQVDTITRNAEANPEIVGTEEKPGLKVGDQVFLTIFKDEEQLPYIQSLYKAEEVEKKLKVINPFDQMLAVGKVNLSTYEPREYYSPTLRPNQKDNNGEPVYSTDWAYIPLEGENFDQTNKIEYIGFEFDIETNFPEMIKGDYYIDFAINGDHKNTYPISASRQFLGNIYDYEGGFKQRVVYKINNKDFIKEFAYRLVQDGRFETKTGEDEYPSDARISLSNVIVYFGQTPRDAAEVNILLPKDNASLEFKDETSRLLTANIVFPDPKTGFYKLAAPGLNPLDNSTEGVPQDEKYRILLTWYKYDYSEKDIALRWKPFDNSYIDSTKPFEFNAPLDWDKYQTQYKLEAYMETPTVFALREEKNKVDRDGELSDEEKASKKSELDKQIKDATILLGEKTIIFDNKNALVTQEDIDLFSNSLALRHNKSPFRYNYKREIIDSTSRTVDVFYTSASTVNPMTEYSVWRFPKNNSVFNIFTKQNYSEKNYWIEKNKQNYWIKTVNEDGTVGYDKVKDTDSYNPTAEYYTYDNAKEKFSLCNFSFNKAKNLFLAWQLPYNNYTYEFKQDIPVNDGSLSNNVMLSMPLNGENTDYKTLGTYDRIINSTGLDKNTQAKFFKIRITGEIGITGLLEDEQLNPIKGDISLAIDQTYQHGGEKKNLGFLTGNYGIYFNHFKTLNNKQNCCMKFSVDTIAQSPGDTPITIADFITRLANHLKFALKQIGNFSFGDSEHPENPYGDNRNNPTAYCRKLQVEILKAAMEDDGTYKHEAQDFMMEEAIQDGSVIPGQYNNLEGGYYILNDAYDTPDVADKYFLSRNKTIWECYSRKIYTDENTQEQKGFSFTYVVKPKYDENLSENTVEACIYDAQQKILLSTNFEPSFILGNVGGTTYSLEIELSQPAFYKNRGTDLQTITATPKLYDNNGNPIDISTLGEGNIQWKWVYNEVDMRTNSVTPETTDFSKYKEIIINNMKEPTSYSDDVQYYESGAEKYIQMCIKSDDIKAGIGDNLVKETEIEIQPLYLTPQSNFALLECQVKVTLSDQNRDVVLKARKAIPVACDENCASISGPISILYDMTRQNPIFDKETSYCVYDKENKPYESFGVILDRGMYNVENVSPTKKENNQNIIVEWYNWTEELVKNNSLLKYAIAHITPNTIAEKTDFNSKYNSDKKVNTLQIDQNMLMTDPATPTCVMIMTAAHRDGEQIEGRGNFLWSQCLDIQCDVYGSNTLNQWDGSLEINDKENYIRAQSFAAGIKNTDNTFTGVVMGSAEGQDLQGTNISGTGIYGLKNGELRFKLTNNADFWVGTGSDSYMSFETGANGQTLLTVKGKIIADEGTIGGWTLKDTYMFSEANGKVTAIQNASHGPKAAAFVAGATGYTDWSGAPFRVEHDGTLKATQADIKGKIEADSGSIGGWLIKKHDNIPYLGTEWGGAQNVTFFSAEGVRAYINAIGSSTEENVEKGTKSCLYVKGNFVVTPDGKMYATEGKIGGWDIKPDYLGKWSTSDTTKEDAFLSFTGKKKYVDGKVRDCFIYFPFSTYNSNGEEWVYNFSVTKNGWLYAAGIDVWNNYLPTTSEGYWRYSYITSTGSHVFQIKKTKDSKAYIAFGDSDISFFYDGIGYSLSNILRACGLR